MQFSYYICNMLNINEARNVRTILRRKYPKKTTGADFLIVPCPWYDRAYCVFLSNATGYVEHIPMINMWFRHEHNRKDGLLKDFAAYLDKKNLNWSWSGLKDKLGCDGIAIVPVDHKSYYRYYDNKRRKRICKHFIG